jgi:pyruvate dehydrogenase E2 component (dihydrolipoamide acetyltransferase)
MTYDVIVPPMGETIVRGRIGGWRKQVGDRVAADEELFELLTDKADVMVPAPAAGILREIRAASGDEVAVGSVVAVIDDGAP